MSLALLLAALLAALQTQRAEAKLAGNCYQWGEGGWDLMWWGDPHVRLPSGGGIPVCGTGSGYVIFRWKDPQGVFQIPSDRCPGSFAPPFNDTFREVAPVSDSNRMGFVWLPPQQPGPYWVTSQAPGACEAGVKVQIEVVGPSSSAVGSPRRHMPWQRAAAAALLALAASTVLLLPPTRTHLC